MRAGRGSTKENNMTSTATMRETAVNELNTVAADTEQLLKNIATAGGEKAEAMCCTVEEKLATARERLQGLEQAAEARVRSAAKATGRYVHGHPWQSIAIAAGVGALVGIIVGLFLNRNH
jgi:ElaB/YqjD/DUF883 family membrane-anchored ribosome-binding protein